MAERFVRFAHDGGVAVGRISGDVVEALPFSSMQDCLSAGLSGKVKYTLPLSRTRLLAPVLPGKIICLGWNYAEHIKELNNKVPTEPMIFFKPPSSVIGPDEFVILPNPALSKEVNNEVELGVVIGKTARNVSAKKAFDFVGGYTVVQDITARDIQWRLRNENMQWEIAKSFDTFAPVGPWIVPAKEIPDPHSLRISLRVNGKTRQDGNTKDMVFKIPQIIEYLTKVMTLNPGDLIATGTPKGVDLIAEGDKMEAEIEKIGILKNTVTLTD
jgi:2-keto-4-pentenoate hydratase/2-oxohepta-3-ene-1,7-dioic acid hydratase in catechol pathway